METHKDYICVDRGQMEADYFHANWMKITAPNRNTAKSIYSRLAGTRYIDCRAVLEKNHVILPMREWR